MIRQLTAMCVVVLWSAGAALASSPQSLDSLAERIGALEYQVKSKGVPVPPMPIPENDGRIQVAQSAASLAVRVDRLETQMRQYTGQMEELNFRIRQLQEQLRRFQEDSEFRFQDLEKGKKRRSSSSTQPQPQQQFEQLGTPPQTLGSLSQDQVPVDDGLIESNPNLTLQGSNQGSGPIDLSSMLGGNIAAPAPNDGLGQSASLTGDPATDYDQAYGMVLQGDYVNAESAFRRFVEAYGNDRLAPNAHYWIGESRYQQGDYRGAIQVFLDAYSAYPNAQKAPDMLLKTGMSLRQIKQRDAACATYEELLSKYPNASSGIRQKVLAEIKSAQC